MVKQYVNTGGSGGHSSLQRYVIDWRRKARTKKASEGFKFSEQELKLYLSGETVQCLECGQNYRKLATHLRASDCLDKEDYCEKYGIPIGTSFNAKDLRELNSKYSKERWEAGCMETEAFKLAAKANGKSMGGVAEGHCGKCNKLMQTTKSLLTGNRVLCDECKPLVRREISSRSYKKCLTKLVKVNCCHCQKEYEAKKKFIDGNKRIKQRNYCSPKCRGRATRKKEWKVKTCKCCQKVFETGHLNAIYCCKKCYFTARKQPTNWRKLK